MKRSGRSQGSQLQDGGSGSSSSSSSRGACARATARLTAPVAIAAPLHPTIVVSTKLSKGSVNQTRTVEKQRALIDDRLEERGKHSSGLVSLCCCCFCCCCILQFDLTKCHKKRHSLDHNGDNREDFLRVEEMTDAFCIDDSTCLFRRRQF